MDIRGVWTAEKNGKQTGPTFQPGKTMHTVSTRDHSARGQAGPEELIRRRGPSPFHSRAGRRLSIQRISGKPVGASHERSKTRRLNNACKNGRCHKIFEKVPFALTSHPHSKKRTRRTGWRTQSKPIETMPFVHERRLDSLSCMARNFPYY